MINVIMFNNIQGETKMLETALRDLTACYSDEHLGIQIVHTETELQNYAEVISCLDLALIDVTLPGALGAARMLRERFKEMEIVIIADLSVSPMQYMHPAIRASSLLLRPVTESWKKALRDLFSMFLKSAETGEKKGVLRIESRDGKIRIPYERIWYLEAREKKVFVRTRIEEFGISEALEKMAEKLPECFVRCHRSYIVNADHIEKIKFSENMIYLSEGLFVPVSRSYKGVFKKQE